MGNQNFRLKTVYVAVVCMVTLFMVIIRTTKELHYQPRPLTETLQDTVRWLAEHNRVETRV